MEIRNEGHAKEMLAAWRELAAPLRRKEISQAIQELELSALYYGQKGSSQGVARCERCIHLLREELAGLRE